VGSSDISPVEVMKKHRVIAVVGASKNPEKDAYTVPAYLRDHGYTIIPINPTTDTVLGMRAYPGLRELPPSVASEVDVVNVFRPSEELPEIARQTVELRNRSGQQVVFWAQLGLENDEAKKILEANGVPYVMNACMRVVHQLHLAKRG